MEAGTKQKMHIIHTQTYERCWKKKDENKTYSICYIHFCFHEVHLASATQWKNERKINSAASFVASSFAGRCLRVCSTLPDMPLQMEFCSQCTLWSVLTIEVQSIQNEQVYYIHNNGNNIEMPMKDYFFHLSIGVPHVCRHKNLLLDFQRWNDANGNPTYSTHTALIKAFSSF